MIIEAFYYFLPEFIANSIPPLVRNIPFLDRPLDFGKSFSGKRLLGDNKTIRGFVFAVILGTLFFYIQTVLYSNNFFRSISLIDYQHTSLVLGFLLSFGAMVGDAIISFLKRRMNECKKYYNVHPWLKVKLVKLINEKSF